MKYFYLFFLIFSAYSFSIGSEKVNDNCPSFLDHEIRILDSQNFENLCKYKNKVIMVVNVASRCGFTYQYENLQKLYSKYNILTYISETENSNFLYIFSMCLCPMFIDSPTRADISPR